MVRSRSWIGLLLALIVAGCQVVASGAPTPILGTPFPTWAGAVNPGVTIAPTYIPPPPSATPNPASLTRAPASTGWTQVATGIGQRSLSMNTRTGAISVIAVLLEPQNVSFSVYYTPGQLHSLSEWRVALPAPLVLVNGNFFDTSNNALGLVVSNSSSYGGYTSRNDAGLFQVQNGVPRVRSMWLEPYNPAERFEQAVQGYPLLTARGQAAPISPDLDQGTNRRTVVANDRYGRVLFFITPLGGCTLQEMASWLTSNGLEIDMALNLDGGRSTQMVVGGQLYPGLSGIPLIIAVSRK